MSDKYDIVTIPLDDIKLNLNNPRFWSSEDESEAIAKICSKGDVHLLAKDIVDNDLDPLDQVVISSADGVTVADGNRRICALKLLKNPDLAPEKMDDVFQKIVTEKRKEIKDWQPISEVEVIIFRKEEDEKKWILRKHAGYNRGVGKRDWDPLHQARYGAERYQLPYSIIKYAIGKGFMNKEDAEERLTVAEKYLDNAEIRKSIGIEVQKDPFKIYRTYSEADFDLSIKKFIDDLKEGVLTHSSSKKSEINKYAEILKEIENLSGIEIEPKEIDIPKIDFEQESPPTSRRTRTSQNIKRNPEVMERIGRLGNSKLWSFYNSITSFSPNHHSPLITIGIWAFFETLTAVLGRKEDSDFLSFINSEFHHYFRNLERERRKEIKDVLKKVRDSANLAKHRREWGGLNGQELQIGIPILEELIMHLIDAAIEQNSRHR